MDSLFQDVRFALRLLARQKGFTAVAVLTLALGVGANTAIFSIVNRTLLAPLPFGDADRLVQVWETLKLPTEYYAQNTPAPGTLEIWNAHSESADGLAAYSVATVTLTGGGEPEQLTAIRASVNLLDVFKIAPVLGRNFQPSDDVAGAPDVVLLTHQLWTRRFNRDPAVVGQTISINGAPALIAGVMPPEVPLSLRPVDLWMPIRLRAAEGKWNRMLWVVARLKPGVTPASFQRQLDAGMHADGPDKMDVNVGVNVQPMDAEVRGGVRPDLVMVFSVTLAVLLIACTNIATMLMARSIVRRRELSVRAALGAGRGRLVRMLLVESLVLGLAGAAAGMVIGAWSLGAIRAAMPDALALQISGAIDGRVLIFSIAVALATSLVFGLAPIVGLSSRTLTVTSRSGDGQERSALRWLRSSLVVVEMALAVVLLAGAALLVKTFATIVTTTTGFSAEHVLTAQVYRNNASAEARTEFYSRLVEELSTSPGVAAVGLINGMPLRFTGGGSGFEGEGAKVAGGFVPGHDRIVSAGYFDAMSIPILRGERFTGRERPDVDPVAIVSQAMSDALWGAGVDPIGRRIRLGSTDSWRRVIGVAGDIRLSQTIAFRPHVYFPFTQMPSSQRAPGDVIVKTTGEPSAFGPQLRAAVARVDADQPVASILTLDQLLARSVGRRRFTLTLMGAFAALALTLAAIGIYGVLSYTVRRRTREIGVRLAIGATSARVRADVLGHGLRLAGLGAAIGLALAYALARWASSLVPGLSTPQAVPMVSAAALLILVAAIACDIPARRAMRVDPISALRAE